MKRTTLLVVGCLCTALALVGCGGDSSVPSSGGSGASATSGAATSGAANQPQPANPLQAELQTYLIERAKKQNPQVADQDAQTQARQQLDAYLQLVNQKCRWSELLDAGQRSGQPSADVAKFVDVKIEDAMQQMFKTRREFEFEMSWSDDLYADHANYGKMSKARQELVLAALKVDAQLLFEKLAEPGPAPPPEPQ